MWSYLRGSAAVVGFHVSCKQNRNLMDVCLACIYVFGELSSILNALGD